MPTFKQATLFNSEVADDTLLILWIPGRDRNNNDLAAGEQERWAREAMKLLGGLFGGSTRMPVAEGSWLNPETDELICEPVILIHCYVRASDIISREKMHEVACFMHRMGRETEQGEVAVVIGETFHRIREFTLA